MTGVPPSAKEGRSVLWVNQFAVLPSDGGGTRHFELGRELARRGWNVSLMASDFHLHRRVYTRRSEANDRSVIVEDAEGVRLMWMWAAGYARNNWSRFWNWLTFSWSVVTSKFHPDCATVVIGSSPQLLAALAARVLAYRNDVPFILEVRDLWPESLLAAGGRRGVAYAVLYCVARYLYCTADRIIVLAAGARDYLIASGVPASRIELIPNGVDTDAVAPRKHLRNDGTNPFTFVYAGAFGPANGLDCVLDAADLLGPAAGVRFVLIGDGPSRNELMREAARRGIDCVQFMPSMPKAEVAEVLRGADAGLMVLRDAALFSYGVSPNKLFDYLAAGLPVLCNVPGEVADLLRAADAGHQVPDASSASLAAGAEWLASRSTSELRRLSANGRAWVEREHSRGVLGGRLEECLSAVLTGQR